MSQQILDLQRKNLRPYVCIQVTLSIVAVLLRDDLARLDIVQHISPDHRKRWDCSTVDVALAEV